MFNVLKHALPVVNRIAGAHTFKYRTYQGDSVTSFGVVRPVYSAWKECVGSVQPQDSSIFDMEGTEPSKRGILVWANINFNTLDVQAHCDQVLYDGRVFNCDRCTNWYGANGWHTFSCSEDKFQGTWTNGESGGSESESGESE